MKLLFGSFWRAVAYCLHPKVIALSLLPLLVAGVVTLGAGFLFWENAVSSVRTIMESWGALQFILHWIAWAHGDAFRTTAAALIVIYLSIPVIVTFTIVLVAVWVTPASVQMVSRRRFPLLERRHGGSWWKGLMWAILCTIGALLMVTVTLPFWLVPGVAVILPPLVWGWLTARVMGFDALAEHASIAEREAIVRAHQGPLLVMGVMCGLFCSVPSMIWTINPALVILAPFLMVPVIWLYTMVFTFSALWFTHYCLTVLANPRVAESAMRAAQPAVALSSDLQLVEEVPPHERFGYEDSRPLEP